MEETVGTTVEDATIEVVIEVAIAMRGVIGITIMIDTTGEDRLGANTESQIFSLYKPI